MSIELIQHGLLGICFLFLVWSIVRPYLGLLAYMIIYFTRVCEAYPVLGQIRLEMLAGTYVVLRMLIDQKPASIHLRNNSSTKAFVAFMVVVFLSVPFAVSMSTSWEWAIYYLKRFAFALMILLSANSKERLRSFFWAFSLLTCWLALGPFINYLNGMAVVAQGVHRIYGTTGYFDNPNTLAAALVQALPLLWGIGTSTRRILTKIVVGALGLFCIVTVIMTGSRAGFLGIAVLALILIWRSSNRKRAIAVGVCLFIIMLAVMGPEYRMRQATTLEFGRSDYSAESRIWGLIHGFSMLVRRPILGVGIGCYPVARAQWFGWGLWSHNLYGQLMGELGLVGVVVWVWLILSVFHNTSLVRSFFSLGEHLINRGEFEAYARAIENLFIMELVVGMTAHSLHSEIWYLFAAVSTQLLMLAEIERVQTLDESCGEVVSGGPRDGTLLRRISPVGPTSQNKEKKGSQTCPI